MNCTIRVPIAGVAEYYIHDVSDEAEAKERAWDMAKEDVRTNGRRFELEAVMTLSDASYQEIEVDDIEEDEEGPNEDGEIE